MFQRRTKMNPLSLDLPLRTNCTHSVKKYPEFLRNLKHELGLNNEETSKFALTIAKQDEAVNLDRALIDISREFLDLDHKINKRCNCCIINSNWKVPP